MYLSAICPEVRTRAVIVRCTAMLDKVSKKQVPGRLVFLDDSAPGITRRLLRGKWAYFDPQGQRIKDPEEVARLNRIALPPAYQNAWYAPRADAHLLAVGFDARGRKQYRYHPD